MFVQSNFDKQVPTWSIAPGVEEKKKSTIYVKDIQRATFPVADQESIMIPSSLGDTKEIYWMLTQICYVNISSQIYLHENQENPIYLDSKNTIVN